MPTTALKTFTDRHLPLIIFLSPVLAVNIAYLTASVLDHVPDCITYLSGCTSISSTGRVMPQQGIFLAGMVPTALLSTVFWTKAENWFAHHSPSTSGADRSLSGIGAMGSLFLLVYVSTLWIPGELYALTRKFAVLLYFGFTYIAQLLLARRLYALGREPGKSHLRDLASQLKWYCAFVLMCGISIVPISLVPDPLFAKRLENIVEWNYALLLYFYFVIVYLVWRRHGPDFASSVTRPQ